MVSYNTEKCQADIFLLYKTTFHISCQYVHCEHKTSGGDGTIKHPFFLVLLVLFEICLCNFARINIGTNSKSELGIVGQIYSAHCKQNS